MKYILVIFSLLTITTSAYSQFENLTLKFKSNKEIFEIAVNETNLNSKIYFFYYLLLNSPQSKYSTYIKAYFAKVNDNSGTARKLLKECVKKFPDFLLADYELSLLQEDQSKQVRLLEEILNNNIFSQHRTELLKLYDFYLEGGSDNSDILNELKSVCREQNELSMLHYLMGVDLLQSNELALAQENFQKSLQIDSNNFHSRIQLSELGIKQRSFDYFNDLIDFFLKNKRNSIISSSVSKYWSEVFKGRGEDDLALYLNIIQAYSQDSLSSPTPINEFFEVAYSEGYLSKEWGTIFKLLLRSNYFFPNNQETLTNLAIIYLEEINDDNNAEKFFRQALNYSHTDYQRTKNLLYLSRFYENFKFNYDTAIGLIESIKPTSKELQFDRYRNLADLYLIKKQADFVKASEYLDTLINYEMRETKQTETSYASKKAVLEKYKRNAQQLKEFKENHPKLINWLQKIYPKKKLRVNEIESKEYFEYYGLIEKVLKSQENQYVLIIECSQKDLDELLTFIKVPSNQFIHLNKEWKVGTAAELSIEFSNPKLLSSSALLANKIIDISPNGDLIATGNMPIEIWDLRKEIRIGELGIGGDKVEFSPNSDLLATIVNYDQEKLDTESCLFIYDVKTGIVVGQTHWLSRLQSFAWDNKGERIVVSSWDGTIFIYNLQKKQKELLKRLPEEFNRPSALTWTSDGRYIITGYAYDDKLSVWNADDLSFERELVGVDFPHSMGSSKDGKYLVSANNSGFLSVWDTDTWIMQNISIPVLADHMAFHPRKHEVILGDFYGGKTNWKMASVDLQEMKIKSIRQTQHDHLQFEYSPDGSKVYVALEDTIAILRSSNLETITNLEGGSIRALGSEIDVENNIYITYDKLGIHFWDLISGTKLKYFESEVKFFEKLPISNNDFLALEEHKEEGESHISIINPGKLAVEEVIQLDFEVDKWVLQNELLILCGKKFSRPDFGLSNGLIEIYNLKTFEKINGFEFSMITEELDERLAEAGVESVTLNKNDSLLALTTYWHDGWKKGITYSREIQIFDIYSGSKVHSKDFTSSIYRVAFGRDSIINIATSIADYSYNYINGNEPELSLIKKYGEQIIEIKNINHIIKWDENHLVVNRPDGRTTLDFPKNVMDVEVDSVGNRIIILTADNRINFYRLDSLNKRLTIIPKKNLEWIAYTPTGEFVASKNGVNKSYWYSNGKYLDLSDFRHYQEKPEFISEVLRDMSTLKETSIDPTLISELISLVNSFHLLSSFYSETEEDTFRIQFSLLLSDWKKLKDLELEFEHNYYGQIERIERKISELEHDLKGDSIIVSADLQVFDGVNQFQASLILKENVPSIKLHDQNIQINKTLKLVKTDSRPDLWFLGIGISDYENKNYNLKYADRDVKSIEKILLKLQDSDLYNQVYSRVLVNDSVTRPYIIKSISELLSENVNITQDDVFWIYLAGHGKLYKNRELYFMDYGSDLAYPSTGIEVQRIFYDEIEQASSKVGKRIFCLDICHSGFYNNKNSRSENDSTVFNETVQKLFSGNGFVTISSSSGGQLSYEPDSLEHGVFTYAALEALHGNAGLSSDQNKYSEGDGDPYVTLTEFYNYTYNRVSTITSNRQQPTIPLVESLTSDFPISITNKLFNPIEKFELERSETNDSLFLSWKVKNNFKVFISHLGNVSSQGKSFINPNSNTDYYLYAERDSLLYSKTIEVEVSSRGSDFPEIHEFNEYTPSFNIENDEQSLILLLDKIYRVLLENGFEIHRNYDFLTNQGVFKYITKFSSNKSLVSNTDAEERSVSILLEVKNIGINETNADNPTSVSFSIPSKLHLAIKPLIKARKWNENFSETVRFEEQEALYKSTALHLYRKVSLAFD